MKSRNVYSIPFEKNTNFIAGSDPAEHHDHFKHAVDFIIDFNVPILAPLDGEIWNVKVDSKEGGDDEKYAAWKYQNLITIKHSNGEYSQYIHLAYKSALVKIGDKVKKGEIIAKGVDMIGYATAPHLHMAVFVDSNNKPGWKTVEIQFSTKFIVARNTKDYLKELNEPKNKKLKELEKRYTFFPSFQ